MLPSGPHVGIEHVLGWVEAGAAIRPVVLLVLDGLGWLQLQARRQLAPVLTGLPGGPITSVTPSTTAAAMTTITTGTLPGAHGIVGYRVRVASPGVEGGESVLNILRWTIDGVDARKTIDPASFQTVPAFGGRMVPVVTRAEFARTGFTTAHLGGTRLVGWRVPSTLIVEVRRQLECGERLVYAYYDGVDKVAHEFGLGEHYDAEVAATDRLVGELIEALPPHTTLVVTADHGQVHVGDAVVDIDSSLMGDTSLISGEGRFRWLHTDDADRVASRAMKLYGGHAWVRTRSELVREDWFGGPLTAAAESRLGDVALIAHAPIAFADPHDAGERNLVSRHGSLTPDEMLVPFLIANR
jgi:hypothetical protein